MPRRKYPRHYVSLPIEYQVHLHESGDSWSGEAVLKNISMDGLYFMTEGRPMLKTGNIADFIFKILHSHPNREIRGQGMVKCIDQPMEGSCYFGVTVEFLSGPLFIANRLPEVLLDLVNWPITHGTHGFTPLSLN